MSPFKRHVFAAATFFALFLAACGGSAPESAAPDASAAAGDDGPTEAGEKPETPAQSEEDSGDPIPVEIGTVGWIGYGPMWIAIDQGFDEEHGIDLTLSMFNTDAERDNAMLADRTDGSNIATHSFLILLGEQDAELTAFLLQDSSYEADAVIAVEEIQSVSDLAGRQVAYEPRTTSDLLIRHALSEAGLSIDDIESIPIPASEAGTAAIAGQVDVAVSYEPYTSTALGEDGGGNFHTLYTGADAPGLISDIVVLRNDFIAEHPEVPERLLQLWDAGLAFLQENEEEGREIVANAVGADVSKLTEAFDGVEFFDSSDTVEAFSPGSEFFATVDTMMEILVEQEAVSKTFDYEDGFTDEYAKAVSGE